MLSLELAVLVPGVQLHPDVAECFRHIDSWSRIRCKCMTLPLPSASCVGAYCAAMIAVFLQVTPETLQRKRRKAAIKKARYEKSKAEAAEYHKLLMQVREGVYIGTVLC